MNYYTASLSILHISFTAYHPSNSRMGVASWDKMLAKIMLSEAKTGTCGDQCFVTVNGETRVFPVGTSTVFSSSPCDSFICKVKKRSLSGSVLKMIVTFR